MWPLNCFKSLWHLSEDPSKPFTSLDWPPTHTQRRTRRSTSRCLVEASMLERTLCENLVYKGWRNLGRDNVAPVWSSSSRIISECRVAGRNSPPTPLPNSGTASGDCVTSPDLRSLVLPSLFVWWVLLTHVIRREQANDLRANLFYTHLKLTLWLFLALEKNQGQVEETDLEVMVINGY